MSSAFQSQFSAPRLNPELIDSYRYTAALLG